MIVTTTESVEGRRVVAYLGLVTGEAILGVNIFRDLFSESATSSAVARAATRSRCARRARRRSPT